MLFGKGSAKQTASGAAIIHFGGIYEIYFPPCVNESSLITAVIAGGMSGVFTLLTLTHSGLVAPASPGSIFAVLLMTLNHQCSVILSVLIACAVSFVIASFF